MIEAICSCATSKKLSESLVGQGFRCPTCSLAIQLVSGEQLAEGNGAGDFDAGLTVTAGPGQVDTRMLLGGIADINIGKLPDRQIVLPGAKVSRGHCKLQRVDFGPSRWKLIDNKSTNGLFVNGKRVTEHDLQDNDVITVGEYQLKFSHFEPPAELPALDEFDDLAPAPVPSAKSGRALATSVLGRKARPAADVDTGPISSSGPAPVCPSCEKTLNRSAKICVGCGINVATGRPVLTSQGVDEDSLYSAAYQWIRFVSLLVWITPMPIPIRSAAFGTRKPYAIWTIAAATILASVTFFVAQNFGNGNPFDRPGKELMLWPTHASALQIDTHKLDSVLRRPLTENRKSVDTSRDDEEGAERPLSDEEVTAILTQFSARSAGDFHWYQLITHAFLHDTSSIYGFLMHLAGNLMFMLVFGTRVNALIGNIATAIVYPVLAVCAAGIYLLADKGGIIHPMLGASGAIMGLAGMYLVLFPAHRVYCAMWISIWLRFRRIFGCKIFQLRGFWILMIYFGYDVLMNSLTPLLGGSGGGVAHMAHIGGFLTGMALGLGVLLSRQWNTHGGDVLSVTLGKHAWPLIGKPARWNQVDVPLPRAVSLTYG